jgi:hypothetical protein
MNLWGRQLMSEVTIAESVGSEMIVSPFREVLANDAVEVLVTAALPRAVWVCEVHRQTGHVIVAWRAISESQSQVNDRRI